MDQIAENTKKKIDKVLEILKTDLDTIRTGRATPALVENIIINAYGGSAKLKVMELATVSVTDASTLMITPFDATQLDDIQKGIELSNTGFTPSNDGIVIRISIPQLSQERREELIKAMKLKLENGKIMVRQVRHEAMDNIKKEYEGQEDEIKRLEKEVQKLIDDTVETIDNWGRQKESELMQI